MLELGGTNIMDKIFILQIFGAIAEVYVDM